jgi:hypothetical protein
MSSTPSNSPFVPPVPQLTGDYSLDANTISDYLFDLFTAATSALSAISSTSLPDPTATTTGTAQLTANAAYNFATAINNALHTAGITGFPVTPPTS